MLYKWKDDAQGKEEKKEKGCFAGEDYSLKGGYFADHLQVENFLNEAGRPPTLPCPTGR